MTNGHRRHVSPLLPLLMQVLAGNSFNVLEALRFADLLLPMARTAGGRHFQSRDIFHFPPALNPELHINIPA